MEIVNFRKDSRHEIYRAGMGINSTPSPLYYLIDGYSSLNIYTPFYALFTPKVMYKELQIIHYGIEKRYKEHFTHTRNYRDLYNLLNHSTLPTAFSTTAMRKPIHAMKGILFEEGVNNIPIIHFLLTIESNYIFTMNPNELDKKRIVLFLSRDFATGKSFGNIYRKINKDIIIPLQESGVDVIVTSDVKRWCYKNNLTLPKFKTINSRNEYLNKLSKQIFI